VGGGGKENIALLNMAIIYFGEKFVHWRLAIICPKHKALTNPDKVKHQQTQHSAISWLSP